MKKKNIGIIVTAVVVAVAGVVYFAFGKSNTATGFTFVTQKANIGNIANSITATGTIEPVTEVTVGTQVSGIISKIYVDYNSVVKKGQVIAEMDRVNLNNELQSATANYTGAKAAYEYQSSLFQRNKALHEKQLISDVDYEQSRYNYQQANSAFLQAKATLAKAQQNLSYATITSPIDGVVTSRSVEEGQTVASGFSTPTLFTIAADLTKMRVIADVDEADIADVTVGNKVTFTVDAYPNDTFEGEVAQVRLGTASSSSSSSSTTSSETVITYEVVITADNSNLKLKPRLTANVTIFTRTKDDVLVVPNRALRFQPTTENAGDKQIVDTEAKHKVWVLEGNKIKAIAVEKGMSDNSNTEIKSGISKGTEVIVDAESKSTAESTTTQSERSPFMPTPPGGNRKTK